MNLASVSETVSGVAVLTAAFPTIGLAVLVAAVRAFPGWGGGGIQHLFRAVVLVTAPTYLVLASIGFFALLSGLLGFADLERGDLLVARNFAALGLAVAGLLFAIALFSPPNSPNESSLETARIGLWSYLMLAVVVLASPAIYASITRPLGVLAIWVAFVLAIAAYDWLLHSQVARSADQQLSRTVGELDRLKLAHGKALRGCSIVTPGANSPIAAGWTTPTPSATHIWLDLDAARDLAEFVRQRPLASAPLSYDRSIALQTSSWNGRTTLRLGSRTTGSTVLYREQREPSPDTRRHRRAGQGVGLILVPVWELRELGLDCV